MIIIGILICIIWFCTINNYSKRNKVKLDELIEFLDEKLGEEDEN